MGAVWRGAVEVVGTVSSVAPVEVCQGRKGMEKGGK